MTKSSKKSYPTLGQRVLAAVMSYQLGHVGVDHVLKEYYSDGPANSWWEEKGKELQRELVAAIGQSLQETPGRAAEEPRYDTKAEMSKLLDLFLAEASTGAFVHVAQHYTGSKTTPGLVIYMASCPDQIAEQLHTDLDEAGKRLFAKHDIRPVRRQ